MSYRNLFFASDYAYGLTDAIPACYVALGNGTTGSGSTVQTREFQVAALNGRIFSPFATTAPITIDAGTNQETVTPTAVSTTYGIPQTPGYAQITASFSNTHGQGALITTGTAGLQEAINDASTRTAAGSKGVVIIDGFWSNLGGTNAMYLACTLPVNVQVQDWRGNSPYNSVPGPLLLSGTADAISPHLDGYYVVTKSGVDAMTLAAPSASDNGKVIIVTSRTANAHTITATSLLANGTATKTTATFGAFAGATIVMVADNQLWNVISTTSVTLT